MYAYNAFCMYHKMSPIYIPSLICVILFFHVRVCMNSCVGFGSSRFMRLIPGSGLPSWAISHHFYYQLVAHKISLWFYIFYRLKYVILLDLGFLVNEWNASDSTNTYSIQMYNCIVLKMSERKMVLYDIRFFSVGLNEINQNKRFFWKEYQNTYGIWI